ncbi:CCA tRNA nucleotidyltransferase [Rhodobacterales bacterium 52_120_T64]|nr:CCA tRNA nucleotidyltransferase [Rhodobacterales bacterium 52_120_T64]
MRVTGDWLTSPDTQAVLGMLTDAGHQAYAVGGCVRNALLGVPVADVDIATSAVPEEVIRLASEAGLKPVPTGLEHGTITVVSNGEPHEVTTFRKDVDTDGRRAVVAFSDNISDDAIRRDFTVNALYVEADGTLHDPLDGLPDIKVRRIRFIEDAAQRIEEDYLRILRFFRFTAWYGDQAAGLDREGLAACATHVDGISKLSKERLGAEMKKLLAAPDPAPALAAMAVSGVLAQILPGTDPQFISPLVFLEQSNKFAPRWQRRMIALGGDGYAKRLRLSKAESKQLDALKRAIQSGEQATVMAYKYGSDAALGAKLIEAATLSSPISKVLEQEINKGEAAVFPLRGSDLIGLIGAGPHLGNELKRLENLWISSNFKLTSKELLQA